MKSGRMKTVLWRWASFSALAIAAIFTLAYGAGARSGGLSLLDFGALPSAAGLRLLAAALLALIVVGALMWTTLRILHPLERLTHYAGRLGEGDMDLAPPMESEDDFGFIAEQLARSAEQLATAAADQRQLADLQARVAAFDETAQRAAAGDFAVRAADEGDDALAQALRSFNQLLMRISAVLASAAATATALSDTTAQAQTTSQQAGRTLMDQDRELAGAANAFAAIPPSFKQVADSAETVSRTSQQAAASTEVVAQNVAAAQPQAQQVLASLRTAAGTLRWCTPSSRIVPRCCTLLAATRRRWNRCSNRWRAASRPWPARSRRCASAARAVKWLRSPPPARPIPRARWKRRCKPPPICNGWQRSSCGN